MRKQKLSPEASKAKAIRDKKIAMTGHRRKRKNENERMGQRPDSDIHHTKDGKQVRVPIKDNRGNFGKGTKSEGPNMMGQTWLSRKVQGVGPNMVDKSKMSCNKPTKSSRPGKKKMVKACSGGKEKIIHFGASGYGHNYSAAARKSFKARHKCGSANDKLSARYWACKNLWAGKGGSTKSSPKSKRGKY